MQTRRGGFSAAPALATLRSSPRKREPDERAEDVRDPAFELGRPRRDVAKPDGELEHGVTLTHLPERNIVRVRARPPARVHALRGVENDRRRGLAQLPSKIRIRTRNTTD